jgi:SAM-dependent methyltransferase
MAFGFFKRGGNSPTTELPAGGAKIVRRSSGLAELNKLISGREEMTVLDLGPTSPPNIRYLTERGHSFYNEDVLLSSFDPAYALKNDKGDPTVNVEKFLSENLKHKAEQFDLVLAWDVPDYLPEPIVKPLVDKLAASMRPGGVLLAFFHTRDAGPDAPYYRYHLAGTDSLELQRGPQFRLQRVFNNRHIENLFREFASIKFFLARDNVREVLVVR